MPFQKGNQWRFKKGHKKGMTGKHHSKETKKKVSEHNARYWLGKKRPPHSQETKEKISLAKKGTRHSKKAKEKIGKANKGNKSHFWKGGLTPKNKLIRNSSRFKQWRKLVFKRDNWTCWICREKGVILHPHHLKSFSKYPKLRFKVSNGLTLCNFCHRIYTNFGIKERLN